MRPKQRAAWERQRLEVASKRAPQKISWRRTQPCAVVSAAMVHVSFGGAPYGATKRRAGRGGVGRGQVSQLERARGPRSLPPALPQHKKQVRRVRRLTLILHRGRLDVKRATCAASYSCCALSNVDDKQDRARCTPRPASASHCICFCQVRRDVPLRVGQASRRDVRRVPLLLHISQRRRRKNRG